MATTFEVFGGVQPWEEQQSPSPEEQTTNPYEETLASHPSNKTPSPIASTPNTLHRQLSGDPDHPPPAWRRRSSNSSSYRSGSLATTYSSFGNEYSNNTASSSPRIRSHHPGLTMTPRVHGSQMIGGGRLIHDTPEMIAGEFDLPLPQPSFRRRAGGPSPSLSSNRSSYADGLNSEELWALDSGDDSTPDASNPMRSASERPLDTVRRMSQRLDNSYPGIPQELIWPTAPPTEYQPPSKSKSFTHLPSISRRGTKRASKRDSALDLTSVAAAAQSKNANPKSNPNSKSSYISPIVANDSAFLSSASSSVVSLTPPNPISSNKSQTSLKPRPTSLYYSRDFLSGLAPREGGYAIAAQMGGNPYGSPGFMDDRRRSPMMEQSPRIRTNSRAPMAKSAGMGRWSLEGGDDFTRKVYTTSSAATTSSNLSTALEAIPVEEFEPSPAQLPEGASPAQVLSPRGPDLAVSSSSTPAAPVPAPAPGRQQAKPAVAPPPTPATTKSSKQLAKEAKAAAKAEAALAKQRQKEAEIRAKEDAKRKEREEKERRKQEKAQKKLGASASASSSAARNQLRSPSQSSLGLGAAAKKLVTKTDPIPPVPAIPSQHWNSAPPSAPPSAATALSPPRQLPAPASASKKTNPSVFAAPSESSKLAKSTPAVTKPQYAQSFGSSADTVSSPRKRGLLGTIKKRFSVMVIDSKPAAKSTASQGTTPSPSSGLNNSPRVPPPVIPIPTPVPVEAAEETIVVDAEVQPETVSVAAPSTPVTMVKESTDSKSRLPARSSSLFHSPPAFIPDTPSFRRSNSHANHAASPAMSFPALSKAVSHDSNAAAPATKQNKSAAAAAAGGGGGPKSSPSPSLRRLSGFGPRVMPPLGRPSSTSTSSNVSSMGLGGGQGDHVLSSSAPSTEVVTPSVSSSAESHDQSFYPNTNQSNTHTSQDQTQFAGQGTPALALANERLNGNASSASPMTMELGGSSVEPELDAGKVTPSSGSGSSGDTAHTVVVGL